MTCTYPTADKGKCNCNFCAWCLRVPPDGDVYGHINHRCPEAPNHGGKLYGTQEQFQAHHGEKRKIQMVEYLKKQPKDLQRAIVERFEGDLKEYGMEDLIREYSHDPIEGNLKTVRHDTSTDLASCGIWELGLDVSRRNPRRNPWRNDVVVDQVVDDAKLARQLQEEENRLDKIYRQDELRIQTEKWR